MQAHRQLQRNRAAPILTTCSPTTLANNAFANNAFANNAFANNAFVNIAFASHAFANNAFDNNVFANNAFASHAFANKCMLAQNLPPLKLAMPSLAHLQTSGVDKLSHLSSMDALCLTQAGNTVQFAQQEALPAVDMIVLSNTSATQNTNCDVVKVSYTSAEDLADTLLSTSEATHQMNSRLDSHEKHIKNLS
jgi:hypothetical protein